VRYRDEAERERRRLGHRIHRRSQPAAVAGTGVETLTRRELEIARRIVDRQTNRQIAQDLFLSPKTVESHIRNIFAAASGGRGGGERRKVGAVAGSAVERYLRLGLQLGRHVDGIVDAYYGPPELAIAVDAEPPVDPRALVATAELLLDELEQGWLRDQVLGARAYAGVLAGESGSYADEAEGCYGVRPTHTDEAVFAAAHERLAELLPGHGPLAERYERWQASILVPAEQVEHTVVAVIEAARAWTRGLVELPEGEAVVVKIVRDKPWLACCDYLGGLRSHIAVNVDVPMSALELLRLTSHETYPGHHAERTAKDDRLVRGQGLLEETLVLLPTPQSLVSEGIAELGPTVLLEGDGGSAVAAVVHHAGIELDLAHALAVDRALEPCRWAEVNAALMLHQAGASEADARAYLERWGLMTPALAAHMIRFLTAPTSRTSAMTYPAGRELCRSYVAGDPERFRRLLTEQVRVGDLLEAKNAGAPIPSDR
jgi:DNA-binding CsgD family transcriptional regulator